MSIRSRIAFLAGSLFALSLLAAGILSVTIVSAQSSAGEPAASPAALTSAPGRRAFLPMIRNNPSVTRYVSPSGSDGNPGSLGAPWRTIQKAANSLAPGDTVLIRAGTYHERVVITRSGNANMGYITFMNYPGESPVIDGTGISITPTAGLIHMSNVSYIKIAGLRVINSDDAGILARSSNHIIVQRNSTQNTHSSGVSAWNSDSVLIDGNTVVDARYVDQASGGHEESISLGSVTNFEVKNNDVSLSNNTGYLGNEGIDIKESSRNGKVHDNYVHNYPNQGGAIYVDAWNAGLNGKPTLSNIEIYNNRIENAGQIEIGAESGGTAENIKVYNNVLINVPAVGVGISRTGFNAMPNGNGPRRNIEIYNNTIYKSRWNGGAGVYIESANISNIVIRNNIINMSLYNGEIVLADPAALGQIKADHNLVYGPKYCSQAYPSCVEVSNVSSATIFSNLTADPKFANPASLDLRLTTGSPAIDAGTNLTNSGVVADFGGGARPQGSGFDIGAYEYMK